MKNKDVNSTFGATFCAGDAFLLIPRKIFTLYYSQRKTDQQMGSLLLVLMTHVYHSNGKKLWRNCLIPCGRGEYVGSYRELCRLTGIHLPIMCRMLNKLERMGFIHREAVPGGTRIRLVIYLAFLDACRGQSKKLLPGQGTGDYLSDFLSSSLPTEEALQIADQALKNR